MVSLAQWVVTLPDGPWYRRQEIADMLGVTKHALLALKQPELQPTKTEYFGATPVDLYDRPAYERLREHFQSTPSGAGRPRTWTTSELTARRKISDRIRYYLRQERTLRDAGEPAKADKAAGKAAELRKQLEVQARRKVEGGGTRRGTSTAR